MISISIVWGQGWDGEFSSCMLSACARRISLNLVWKLLSFVPSSAASLGDALNCTMARGSSPSKAHLIEISARNHFVIMKTASTVLVISDLAGLMV